MTSPLSWAKAQEAAAITRSNARVMLCVMCCDSPFLGQISSLPQTNLFDRSIWSNPEVRDEIDSIGHSAGRKHCLGRYSNLNSGIHRLLLRGELPDMWSRVTFADHRFVQDWLRHARGPRNRRRSNGH